MGKFTGVAGKGHRDGWKGLQEWLGKFTGMGGKGKFTGVGKSAHDTNGKCRGFEWSSRSVMESSQDSMVQITAVGWVSLNECVDCNGKFTGWNDF